MARAWRPQSQSCGPQRLHCPLALASPWTYVKNKKAREDCRLSRPSSPEETPGATPHLRPAHPEGTASDALSRCHLPAPLHLGVPAPFQTLADTHRFPRQPRGRAGLDLRRKQGKMNRSKSSGIGAFVFIL
ncbi:hypothetical protein HJG60_008297 [Phyllostomus discolor]|uniref:Uncharacterized protein n=1 Tax=Phyllostomus discolor TaxID=89673 RepID=A0A833Z9E2_9CHIR|nr:hypothetical protein HJG60_008297 [Phyllostomus discolor]